MNSDFQKNDDREIEIDLVEIYYLFVQKLKLVILMAVLGALIVGSYTYFLVTPTYEATSKLYVVSASNDSVVNLSDLQIGTNLTADYKELILSRPMLESCMKNLNLDDKGYTVDSLKKALEIANPSGTRIINITATTTDPKLSADIATQIAQLAKVWLPEIMETNDPNIVESAKIPEKPASPDLIKNTIIGAMALAILYFAIVVIKYLFNDTISSAEEFEKYFGITPLTSVPESSEIKDNGKSGKHERRKKA